MGKYHDCSQQRGQEISGSTFLYFQWLTLHLRVSIFLVTNTTQSSLILSLSTMHCLQLSVISATSNHRDVWLQPPPTTYKSVPRNNGSEKPLRTSRRSYITMITIHHLCTPIGKLQLHLLPNEPLTPASNNIHPGRNYWTSVCNSWGPKRKLEPYLVTNWWNKSTKMTVRQKQWNISHKESSLCITIEEQQLHLFAPKSFVKYSVPVYLVILGTTTD